jgi:hypothetical protein
MDRGRDHPVQQVPRDESGRLELLALRPPFWEYLLFGCVLYRSRAVYEPRWRDHQLGYALRIGPAIDATQIPGVMSERLSHLNAIIGNLEAVVSPRAQLRAFGEPGEPGDPVLIEHMASRVIDLYALMLDWAEETRALRVPGWAERIKELLVEYVKQPIERTHVFVDEFIEKLEQAIAHLTNGTSDSEEVTINLKFEISDELVREYKRELKRIRRHMR